MFSGEDEDAIRACAGLVERAGAKSFEVGYLRDDVPMNQAGWYAKALYHGAEIAVEECASPTDAAMKLSQRLLKDATCRCRRRVVLEGQSTVATCRWYLYTDTWSPSCDAPSITVTGNKRGDVDALRAAIRPVGQGEPRTMDGFLRRGQRHGGRTGNRDRRGVDG